MEHKQVINFGAGPAKLPKSVSADLGIFFFCVCLCNHPKGQKLHSVEMRAADLIYCRFFCCCFCCFFLKIVLSPSFVIKPKPIRRSHPRAAVCSPTRFPDFLLIILSQIASAPVDRRGNAIAEAALRGHPPQNKQINPQNPKLLLFVLERVET